MDVEKSVVTKKRQKDEIRDAYMAFTIGVQADDFDKYLPLVMKYMDSRKASLAEMAQLVKMENYKYVRIRKQDFLQIYL
mgnify:CR=1 FL=1